MKPKTILNIMICAVISITIASCGGMYERTNPDDPKSSDYEAPPAGTFVINGGAAATNSTDVTLTMNVLDGAEMRFGNTVLDINSSGWMPYSEQTAWEIEGESNEEKIVYGDFQNSAGDVIRTSDTIIYDTIAPVIETVYPENGATGLGYAINVSAVFSEAIDEATLEGNFTLVDDEISAVEGTVTFDTNTNTALYTPVAELAYNTTFTATLTTAITDIAGNALAEEKVWTFSTVDLNTVQSPVFDIAAGSYTTAQTLAITTGTSGATIKYTTDGSDPKTSGTADEGTAGASTASVTVNATMTVRAYAYKSGMFDSSETSAAYILAPTIASITPSAGYSLGTTSITNLAGTNFKSGASVRIVKAGASDVIASNVVVSGGTQITCDFDLSGIATGEWSVTVTNTDTGTATLSDCFTVDTMYGHLQAYLKGPNTTITEQFGSSVAIDGDTLIVGSQGEDSGTTAIINGTDLSLTNNSQNATGAAYVFVRSGSTWTHQAYLKAPNAGGSDNFGYSVAIDGDTVIVGAPNEDSATTSIINGSNLTGLPADAGSNNGAAYVFVRSSTTWSHEAYLKAPNNSDGDLFGVSVAINGDTAIVGAMLEDSSTTIIINGTNLSGANDSGSENGAAYVFVRSGTTWSHQAYLKAPNNSNGDYFGTSVAVDTNTAVVGAYYEQSGTTAIINGTDLSGTNDDSNYVGAAYVFVRSGTTWSHQAYLKGPNAAYYDQLGYSVAIYGNTVVAGAYGENSTTTSIINGTDISGADDNGSMNGAAYVFTRSGATWSHEAYLKAPNNSNIDCFGISVALYSDMAVVGAYGETSTTTYIINGTDLSTTNNDGDYNGAAYVFTRSGTTWSHYAYLKAPNNSDTDRFGVSVAVFAGTVVVGTGLEDSTTQAIINDSDLSSTNDSGNNNGAAYVFILP